MEAHRIFAAIGLIAVIGGAAWVMEDIGTHAPGLPAAATLGTKEAAPPPAPVFDYIEVTDSCGIHFEGGCVALRTAPATTSPAALELRNGIVLEVATTTVEAGGHTWYKVLFSEWLRYPDRLPKGLYVAAENVRLFTDSGNEELPVGATSTPEAAGKRIVIDRSTQTLTAYDNDTVFLESPVSTGLELTPTPRGTFYVYKKTPTRYMQGPLPGISDQYYDLPGVPWDLYFTAEGGAIHGAYWHNSFGEEWSHGCVNLPLDTAKKLYSWAPLGTEVIVRD